jgi:hypothetical protein
MEPRDWRTMTADEKWTIARNLYVQAKQLKAAALRSQFPEWTEKEIQAEVRRVFLYARTE